MTTRAFDDVFSSLAGRGAMASITRHKTQDMNTMEPHIRTTIEETPPENRPALLPVEKLKKLCLEQFNEYKIQEFRLKLEGSGRKSKSFCGSLLLREWEIRQASHRMDYREERLCSIEVAV
jgi:hypothetical protein